MIHVMVDLETLSTRSNAAILAIGAVKFTTAKGVYDDYYQVVKTPPGIDGFHISADTLHWWAQQSDEARKVFTDPNTLNIVAALKAFAEWMTKTDNMDDICLWGNGAAFDNAILATAYDLCNLAAPWNFWNDRCYRTIKSQNRGVPLTRLGTHHNALADAESQADHLLAMKLELE
jgi:hypothetical protein